MSGRGPNAKPSTTPKSYTSLGDSGPKTMVPSTGRTAREEREAAGKMLAEMGQTPEIRNAAKSLVWMKNQDVADNALLDEFDALIMARGGRRRRMRGGDPEADARAAFAAAKGAFAGFMTKTRELIGKLVGDNILTIVGTGIALNTGAGAAGLEIVKAAAGAGAPYVIGASVALMAAMAIYRMVRTILVITAEESSKVIGEAAKTALASDLKALDAAAAAMIADPNPVDAARTLFDEAKYSDAVKAAFKKGAAAQLKTMVESGKAKTAREKRQAARDAAAAAAGAAEAMDQEAAAAAAAAAAPPAAAQAPPVAEAQAGQAVVAEVAVLEQRLEGESKHQDGGRRLTSRRRRHRVSVPRRTRRSSSGRRRGGSRRRRE